jgi:hypothetical protein
MTNTWHLSSSRHGAGFLVLLLALANAAHAQTPPADPSQHLTDTYLDGKWDELETIFATPSPELQTIPPAKQPELIYIRRTLSECRPAWWKHCKAGEKYAFTQEVFGHSVRATFDPTGKSAFQFSSSNNAGSVSISWPAADMDNPAPAEHGYSKGDLTDLSIWSTLGMADAWSGVPVQTQASLKEDGKLLFQQYLDFRGDVSGVYYGTPRARRWGLWLYMAMYMDKYAKMPIRSSREAVAVMFMSEVVGNPSRYPSIKLPSTLPSEGAEEKLAGDLRGWIEKHGWTVSEDKSLRDAIALFATANPRQFSQAGKVVFANGLVFAFDPEKDKAFRPRRDAWFKAKLGTASPAQ